jgi:probable phosphoglycerate mutase
MNATPNSNLRLHLIRHGETTWSLSGRHTGRTDLALTPHGEAEARELGRRLQKIPFSRSFSSPLARARRTCALSIPGADPAIIPELAEWDYGDYEGIRSLEILRSRPGWNLFRDGCPGGETPEQVGRRADRVLGLIRPLAGNVVLFSHGHFGRSSAPAGSA